MNLSRSAGWPPRTTGDGNGRTRHDRDGRDGLPAALCREWLHHAAGRALEHVRRRLVNESADEECDDKGISATCDIDCTLALCGDGMVNALAGEE